MSQTDKHSRILEAIKSEHEMLAISQQLLEDLKDCPSWVLHWKDGDTHLLPPSVKKYEAAKAKYPLYPTSRYYIFKQSAEDTVKLCRKSITLYQSLL